MQDFKKIRVWHAAHALALDVFHRCDRKLFARHPGLRSQTLRTANSVAANISEGAAKEGVEFARYLEMSLGASNELENHLTFAHAAELLATGDYNSLVRRADLVRRMLINLIRRVRESHRP